MATRKDGEEGILIRAADGKLYFISDNEITRYAVSEELQRGLRRKPEELLDIKKLLKGRIECWPARRR